MNKKAVLIIILSILIISTAYAVRLTDNPNRGQELKECYQECRETKLTDREECNQGYKDERSDCKSTYDSCKEEAKIAYEECKSSDDTSPCRSDYRDQIKQCKEAYKTCKKTSIDTKKSCYSGVKDNDLSCKQECREDRDTTTTTTSTSTTTLEEPETTTTTSTTSTTTSSTSTTTTEIELLSDSTAICLEDEDCQPLMICPTIYRPVCGSDGNTYSNDCEAERANVNVAYEGECTCGDGICQDTSCLAIGCPPPETPETCPQDCKKDIRAPEYCGIVPLLDCSTYDGALSRCVADWRQGKHDDLSAMTRCATLWRINHPNIIPPTQEYCGDILLVDCIYEDKKNDCVNNPDVNPVVVARCIGIWDYNKNLDGTTSCSIKNEFCGGIAGITCCPGLTCALDGSYPDAGGRCVDKKN